jgi:diacylglycerol kinase family enzyme
MPRAAIIVNPRKVLTVPDAHEQALDVSRRLGWDQPAWIETAAEDPGRSMGVAALQDGYDVIVAAGGDGTVRAVAGGVLGSGVPFGIVPMGTGNLLARNLGIPLGSFSAALELALLGRDRPIDVGMVTFDERAPEPFLVITGAGLDADTMGSTNDNLKKLIGWGAYIEAGGRASLRPGFRVGMSPKDKGDEPKSQHVRSYMVCNCGVLTAGIVLVPQAQIDDGLLDTVTIAPYGVVGFAALGVVVATGQPISDRLMSHSTGQSFDATFSKPVKGQIDGDAVGEITRMRTVVNPGTLVVRVPDPTVTRNE